MCCSAAHTAAGGQGGGGGGSYHQPLTATVQHCSESPCCVLPSPFVLPFRSPPPTLTQALFPPFLPRFPSSPLAPCGVQGPDSPLDLDIKILVIGLRGTGKTQLIHSLLGMSSSSSGSNGSSSSSSSSVPLEPFAGGTHRVEVHKGRFLGVGLTLVDTPGLTASAAGAAANASILRGIKAAFKKHSPDLVLYVDR